MTRFISPGCSDTQPLRATVRGFFSPQPVRRVAFLVDGFNVYHSLTYFSAYAKFLATSSKPGLLERHQEAVLREGAARMPCTAVRQLSLHMSN